MAEYGPVEIRDYNTNEILVHAFEEGKDPKLTNVADSPSSASEKQLAANRRNAKLSTGPKTKLGKQRSRCNALQHGILVSKLLVTNGAWAEDCAAFERLFLAIQQDMQPEGELEKLMVQEIAICYWRLGRALQAEAAGVQRASERDRMLSACFAPQLRSSSPPQQIKEPPSLPSGGDMSLILRYETSIHRQLAFALTQLERRQRARKGEHVPAPLSVEIRPGN